MKNKKDGSFIHFDGNQEINIRVVDDG